jgi:ribosomal protein L40E
MPVCQRCGEDNPVRARFCLACGAALAPARPRGDERKVVSVLFCDLVGFTGRAEQLDIEDVRGVLRPYYARLRAELERYGATVEKFIGDAVMALSRPVAAGGQRRRRGLRLPTGGRGAGGRAGPATGAGPALVTIPGRCQAMPRGTGRSRAVDEEPMA